MTGLLNQQLVWLMFGSVSFILSIIWGARPGSTGKRALSAILLKVGLASSFYFVGLVIAQGITFWSITSIQNLWVVILAAFAYMVWGVSFLVVGDYLFYLLLDFLPGLGYAKPPDPIGALINLSPFLAVGLVIAFILFAFVRSKGQLEQTIRQLWGIKYLLILLLLGVAFAPAYTNIELHLEILLETYLFAFFLLVLASTSIEKTERITRRLILASFWLHMGNFSYLLLSRPLLLTPQLSSLSASAIDHVFRLSGNNPSLTLVTLLPFGLLQIWESRLPRWLRVFVFIFISFIVYRTDARTAWIAYVVMLLIFFYLIKDRFYFFLTIGGSIAAVIFLPFIRAKGIGNIVMTGGLVGQENNLSMRVSMWYFALENALTDVISWILGVGWAGTPVEWSAFTGGAGNWTTLHSLWVSVLVYGGLIGLLCWIMFFASGIKNTFVAARTLPGSRNRWLFAGVAAWIGFFFFTLTANANWPQPTQMIILICVNLWAYSKLATERGKNV